LVDVPEGRRARICEIVFNEREASVVSLAQRLAVSTETIRRDIAVLHDQGVIEKVHGGALAPSSPASGASQRRRTSCWSEKRAIASAALGCFGTGDSVMINAGSTTEIFASVVAPRLRISLVTNSPSVARTFWQAGNGSTVFVIGGEMNADTEETFGDFALEQLMRFSVRHAVLSVDGISSTGEISFYRAQAAAIARAMIARASEVTILADHTKLEKLGLFTIGNLTTIRRIVTDQAPSEVLDAAIVAAGVEVIIANTPALVEEIAS
jgi:DeoR family transcriptional regulator, glycerol-3-phosphate regulon repressor